MRAGDLDTALADFDAQVRHSPGDAGALLNRGFVRGRRGEYDAALADYAEVLRLDPKNIRAAVGRGDVRDMKGEYEEAVKEYTRAIQSDPTSVKTYISRGGAYQSMGQDGRALADYAAAARLDPNNELALGSRAFLLAASADDRLRNGKEAVATATRACELSEWKVSQYIEVLAAAHAESTAFALAVKYQEQALAIGKFGKEDREAAEYRLKLFKARKPYRSTLP